MVLVSFHMRIERWEDFQEAHRQVLVKAKEMGCSSSQVYRAEGDPSFVMILQEWPSHQAMHQFTDVHEQAFCEQATVQGFWEIWIWQKEDNLAW